ncbi:MAG: DUF1579 domain-containing protein [Ignavibacteriales bacterium]|jgi:hypothetical protein|nr:DUF1579 domain-containing protein [Ignavibacteriaceae bacterium]NLH62355.1 DUF1579 domain-containing protein [Ignavibacteriales bacterium]HOJ18728.1 DUF1579 domain-containing protein [Ignavibacteriaceae bacterium]HPO56898.1 DUF1579 domain-containing protein [Ignavibacteriaceae bacterium]
MKNIFILLLAVFLLASNLSAQFETQVQDLSAWIEYMTPGDMHKMMQNDAGEWNTTIKMWMDANSEPQITKGHAKMEMVLGGRYLRTHHFGDSPDMPMEGIGYQAYDNIQKEFIATWIDNMGTGMMITRGKYDPKTKTTTMTGTIVDPAVGKEIPVKEISRYINDDKIIMEMFVTYDKGEFKSMEIVMERVK